MHNHVSTYYISKPFILRLHCQQAAQLVKPEPYGARHHKFGLVVNEAAEV